MRTEDGDVGILAHFDRPDTVIDAQLFRRVQRHELQRLLFRHPAPPHALGSFLIEVPDLLTAVRVDGHDDAPLRHEGSVVGNGVVRLHLVRPPVGERRRARPVCGYLIGHLVAFEDVLERRDPEAELLGQA